MRDNAVKNVTRKVAWERCFDVDKHTGVVGANLVQEHRSRVLDEDDRAVFVDGQMSIFENGTDKVTLGLWSDANSAHDGRPEVGETSVCDNSKVAEESFLLDCTFGFTRRARTEDASGERAFDEF